MKKTSNKKIDRRTLYTQNVIKEAFLQVKQMKSYNAITVAELCRKAEISRGTFYRHYNNITDVLDELMEEMLSEVSSLLVHLSLTEEVQCGIPFCHFIRENPKYRCIIMDDTLTSYIIDKVTAFFMDDFVAYMMEHTTLPREQIESIFYFQISGCFTIAKHYARMSKEDWCSIQKTIDTFIKNGLKSYMQQAE